MGYEHHFEYDVPDFVREAEEAMARGETFGTEAAEVTIKFGKGQSAVEVESEPLSVNPSPQKTVRSS